MTKKISYDEVDLIDLFIVVWNKKFIIISITIVAMFFGFIFKSFTNNKITSVIETEIRPLSAFDEAKYVSYNSFIRSLKPFSSETLNLDTYIFNDLYSSMKKLADEKIYEANKIEIIDVDKLFLFDLFVDKISQTSKLKEYIRKSKLIDENDIKKAQDFETAILKIKSSIRDYRNNMGSNSTSNEIKPIIIEFKTQDIEKLEKFLIYLEKEVNKEIQKNIKQMFDDYILYVQSLNEYSLEDINNQLLIVNNEIEMQILESRKRFLTSDKYIERIQNIYENSPVSKVNEFYAAKIIYDIKTLPSEISLKKILIVTGILGVIFGIVIILISNAVKSRRLN